MTDAQNDEVCEEARDICRRCSRAAMCWDTCRDYEDRYDEIARAKGYCAEGGAKMEEEK